MPRYNKIDFPVANVSGAETRKYRKLFRPQML
jgi:hypothetical protein